MKNIDLTILTKRNEIIKLLNDRDILVKLSVEFSKDPESVILKLTGLDILESTVQDKFVMYNKGLVGINTKETSISLAYAELHKVINNVNKSILDALEGMNDINPVITIIDNVKALTEYLDDAGVTNLFNAIDSDKALQEYATYKMNNLISLISTPGSTDSEYFDVVYSIADTIRNAENNVDTEVVSNYNKALVAVAASIKIDSKQIESSLDGNVPVIDKEVINSNDIDVTLSIDSDKLNDYLIFRSHDMNNTTIIKAISDVYNILKITELKLNDMITALTISNYSNLVTVIKNTDKAYKRFASDEYTINEFTKVYSEYNSLTANIFNDVNDVIDSAVINSNNLNKLVYVLYLTKALMEKVLIEATIK